MEGDRILAYDCYLCKWDARLRPRFVTFLLIKGTVEICSRLIFARSIRFHCCRVAAMIRTKIHSAPSARIGRSRRKPDAGPACATWRKPTSRGYRRLLGRTCNPRKTRWRIDWKPRKPRIRCWTLSDTVAYHLVRFPMRSARDFEEPAPRDWGMELKLSLGGSSRWNPEGESTRIATASSSVARKF